MGSTKMAVRVTPSLKISSYLISTLESTTSLELSKWSKIRVTLGYWRDATTFFYSHQITIDKISDQRILIGQATPYETPLSTDVMAIGGPSSFIGDLARFQIFNPGGYSTPGSLFIEVLLIAVNRIMYP